MKVGKNTHNPSFSPSRLPGPWLTGFALDFHTLYSVFQGYDEFGHEQFDTKRTELGELLYRLKYKGDATVLQPIAISVQRFLRDHSLNPQFVVPTPASKPRKTQPVDQIAKTLGSLLGCPVAGALKRTGSRREQKSVHEFSERIKLLEHAFVLTPAAAQIKGARVLLVDDLWRSGATLNAVGNLLVKKAEVQELIALTITRTRSNQ